MIHLAGIVGVEGEGFAGEVHLLQLPFLFPGAVLHRQVHIRGIAAAGVGKHAGGGIAQGDALLSGLLLAVLTYKIHLQGLISLGGHLHPLIDQGHLVDEQITENPRAIHHHIDAGPAQLFERDQLQLVHPAEGIGHGPNTDEPEDLGEGFAIGLDVIGAPEHAGDRFRPGALLSLLALDQPIHHHLGGGDGGPGGNRLGIEGMDVLAAGQHAGIADRITAGTRQHIFTIEGPQQTLHLHIGADLLEAEAQVGECFVQFRLVDFAKATAAAGGQPGGGQLEAETLQQIEKPAEVAAQGHAAIAAGDLLHHRPHRAAAGFGDQLVELHIGEHAGIVALVNVGDGAAAALGQ